MTNSNFTLPLSPTKSIWVLARKTASSFTKGDVIKLVVDNTYIAQRGKDTTGTIISITDLEKSKNLGEIPQYLISILWETGELLEYNELIFLQICKICELFNELKLSRKELCYSKIAALSVDKQVKAMMKSASVAMKQIINQGYLQQLTYKITIPVLSSASSIKIKINLDDVNSTDKAPKKP